MCFILIKHKDNRQNKFVWETLPAICTHYRLFVQTAGFGEVCTACVLILLMDSTKGLNLSIPNTYHSIAQLMGSKS